MTTKPAERADGRRPGDLRPVEIVTNPAPAAPGSVLIRMGRTQVICAVSVEESVPRWMREQKVSGGWLTGEYSMLPYATAPRTSREASTGRVGGRTQEIQRLLGRSLRAVTDLQKLGARTFWVDCDVVQADGGTRTAAITGAFVAYRLAVNALLRNGRMAEDPIREAVGAVSVGLVGGRALLDLCYEEDVAAETDMNVVMTASGAYVEVQGTAEKAPFTGAEMERMLALARKGIRSLFASQEKALSGA
jgi:ribonuclease PH